MSDRLLSLKTRLKELVAIDTTSARSNGPLVERIERELAPAGFRCERQSYRDPEGVEKLNLIAHRGPAGLPELALVGHTDCVPFDPSWREALLLTEKDGRLYGRGSCDTKAYIACAIEAALRTPTTRPLVLIFTADEEIGLVGAKQLVQAGKGKAKRAIVGEPTSLTPVRAHKGYCLAEIEVFGKEGHSAHPQTGASAIFRAARLIQKIETYADGEMRQATDALFSPPFPTLNVGVISGGRAKNVIAGSCRMTFEWRPLPGQPLEGALRRVETLIGECRQGDPEFKAEVRFLRGDPGVDTPASSEIVSFLASESGSPAGTVPFATEAPQLTQLGAQAVVFGPGDIRVAHQSHEFVPIEEFLRCEEILAKAIARFCA
ncbi:MAG: acetylornithine deacetylase [Myxococcaceae bacterium]